jgi:hypothetical protein
MSPSSEPPHREAAADVPRSADFVPADTIGQNRVTHSFDLDQNRVVFLVPWDRVAVRHQEAGASDIKIRSSESLIDRSRVFFRAIKELVEGLDGEFGLRGEIR